MCGRTSCHLPRDVLTRACAYHDRQGQQRLPEWRDPEKYYPSYNKSPQSSSPVLLSRLHLEKGADSSERVIAPMRWGLVPCWFKEADLSKMPFNITNCRSDTILEKRSFKAEDATGAVDSAETWGKAWDNWRLLTMAGIFDCWEPPEGGDPLYSYTIITVDSCKSLTDIHPRMPAILDGEEAVSKWLDFGEVSTQEALKLIHPTENITFHPVSSVVNNSRNDMPECVTPLSLVVRKEPKASGSSQMMMQWLATKSPKKEEPRSPQKDKSDVPQWTSQFLQRSPPPAKRAAPGLLSAADRVENNNSLVRGQRRLVLLGVPFPAAGCPHGVPTAPPRPQPCAPDSVRAPGTAQRRPAPRMRSAEGPGEVHPRLRERSRRGAPRLGADNGDPRGGPASRSSADDAQEGATRHRVLAGPGRPQIGPQDALSDEDIEA
ncbi:5-hydroxymethylcytosine (hmC) binding, ES cell-specific [Ictidomys tridecemlineatus]|nr:5-hydroxymethylcytosine (hmC) binding, ES cell-specific [Ictidomys tridecemlineatus]